MGTSQGVAFSKLMKAIHEILMMGRHKCHKRTEKMTSHNFGISRNTCDFSLDVLRLNKKGEHWYGLDQIKVRIPENALQSQSLNLD